MVEYIKNADKVKFQLNMKAWQLTIYAVPYLRKVLDAVSRTQLDSYGIERNFQEIEEALTSFLRYIRLAKQQNECPHQLESSTGANYQPDPH